MADDLARPIDFDARHGDGLDRTVVLGGGGIYFVAWQTAYLAELRDEGIDLGLAERVVGTPPAPSWAPTCPPACCR